MNKYFFLLVWYLLLFNACSTNTNDRDCPTGKPLAIFSKDMKVVKNHSFSSSGQNSAEEILLSNDVNLEIYQRGCDTLFQSFRFRYPMLIKQDSFETVIDSAILQFKYLSSSDEKLKPFALWSNALTGIRGHVSQGEIVELGKGIDLKIDKLENESNTTILIDVMQIASSTK